MTNILDILNDLIRKKLYIPLFISFSVNTLAYYITRLWTASAHHIDMTSRLDRMIPVIPWTTAIYLSCYAFWSFNYILGATQKETYKAYRFLCADLMAKIACLLIFTLLPTTNIRPVLHGSGVWISVLKFVYRVDAADNLFPSIHCLTSQFCFIAVRHNNDVPLWYKTATFLFSTLICISTLTTKQHVIADVVVGVLLAELCYYIAGITNISKLYRVSLYTVSKHRYSVYQRKPDRGDIQDRP